MNFQKRRQLGALAVWAIAASGLLRANAPPPNPQIPIQGPAWVAVVNRPAASQTLPFFCATNVGSTPLNVYMIVYNTINNVAVNGTAPGIVANGTQTLQPLQTWCVNAPIIPGNLINMWLFGATITGQTNASTVLTELQSLVVSVQLAPNPAYSEGIFVTPVLLNSVRLPGNYVP